MDDAALLKRIERLHAERDREGLVRLLLTKCVPLWAQDVIDKAGAPWMRSRIDDLVADTSVPLVRSVDGWLEVELSSGAHLRNSIRKNLRPVLHNLLDSLHVIHISPETLRKRRTRAKKRGDDPKKVKGPWEQFLQVEVELVELTDKATEDDPFSSSYLGSRAYETFVEDVAREALLQSEDTTHRAIEILLSRVFEHTRSIGNRWICPSLTEAAHRVGVPRTTLDYRLRRLRVPIASALSEESFEVGKRLYRDDWPKISLSTKELFVVSEDVPILGDRGRAERAA